MISSILCLQVGLILFAYGPVRWAGLSTCSVIR